MKKQKLKKEIIEMKVSCEIQYPSGKRDEAVKTAHKTVSHNELAEGRDDWAVSARVAGVTESPVDTENNNLKLPRVGLYEVIINEKLPDFKRLRNESNLTLRQVEENTGISNAYTSQLETGKIDNPSWFTVIKLLKLYYNWGGEAIEEALPINSVSQHVCPCCRNTGWYFVPFFGGGGTTQRCSCGANCG